MSDFLKKMQEALVKGEEDSDVKEYMKTIEDKANKVKDPSKAIDERLKKAGEKEPTEEEKATLDSLSGQELSEHNKEVFDEIKEQDEKWAMLAIIENMKTELSKLKADYLKLKEKYEKNISDIEENIEKSNQEFEEKYGVVDTKSGFEKIKENYESRTYSAYEENQESKDEEKAQAILDKKK